MDRFTFPIMMKSLKDGDLCLYNNTLYSRKNFAEFFDNNDDSYSEQDIYILSDEDIISKDWFLTSQNGHWELQQCKKICADGMIMSNEEEIAMYQSDCFFSFNKECSFKIVGTTNKTLKLLGIPQNWIKYFIKEYNNGINVEKVELEYITLYLNKRHWQPFPDESVIEHDKKQVIKVDYCYNTIYIKDAKTIWNREEVIRLCTASFEMYMSDDSVNDDELRIQFNKWIDKI